LGFSRERKRSTGGEGTRMMDVLSLLFLGRTIGAQLPRLLSTHFWGFPTKRAMLFLRLHCVVNAFRLVCLFLSHSASILRDEHKVSSVCVCVCCASTRRTSFFLFSLLFIVGDEVLMTGHHPEMDALMAIHWRGWIAVGTCPIAHLSADFWIDQIDKEKAISANDEMSFRPPVCHHSSVRDIEAQRRRGRSSNQIPRGVNRHFENTLMTSAFYIYIVEEMPVIMS
jgi:hypothetical protein